MYHINLKRTSKKHLRLTVGKLPFTRRENNSKDVFSNDIITNLNCFYLLICFNFLCT